MRGPGGVELLATGGRQHREGAAGVVGARAALEVALALEAIHQPGQPAATEQHRRGQVVHPHPAAVGVRQVHEHLVGGQRQPVLCEELGVERLGELGMDAQQAAPGAKLARVQGCDRHSHGNHEGSPRWLRTQLEHAIVACATTSSEDEMKLEGLHHVTAITGDAPRNVDFYSRVLGLRMVKKTVNFDAPDVYHLYFGDEVGTPGSILTFFEFPGAAPGRAGDGMVHTVQWRVRDDAALDFWTQRIPGAVREPGLVRFDDPEGLSHELVTADVPDAPLVASQADIPDEHALRGFHGVRAYASDPARSAGLLDVLGFAGDGAQWGAAGAERSGG